ncbi:MAG: flagellar motor stator protein MotA [Legionellales bacterium]|nr:flagellar motor stator protein MotA [Legionellales bacterium]
MFVIIGFLIVIGSVFGGFALAGGHLATLWQPVEVLMIGGSAVGAFLVTNGGKVSKAVLKALPTVFKGDKYNKKFYGELLSLMFRITLKMKNSGPIAIENDIENPKESSLFTEYPLVLKDHHLLDFICDYFRLVVSGTADYFQIENLMDVEIETHHHESEAPASAIQTLADGLPAFGIVAAVMGVVHTMESINLPPAELGILIAAALVGTFLGILLGYGFVGPLAGLLKHRVETSSKAFVVVKVIILATINSYPPAIALEFGRKVLFSTERLSFNELDEMLKELKK